MAYSVAIHTIHLVIGSISKIGGVKLMLTFYASKAFLVV